MATDVDDEYGDEWGSDFADDEGDGGVQDGGAVHPLRLVTGKLVDGGVSEIDSKEVKPTMDRGDGDGKANMLAEAASGSPGDEGQDTVAVGNGSHGDDETHEAKHTRHYQSSRPPTPPISLISPSVAVSQSRSRDDKLDGAAALYARVAATRISEYRETARERQEKLRQHEAELVQRRRDVRRSIHGVATLTPKERLALTVRALKKLAKQSERAADLERKNRWYNKQPVRRNAATTHAQQLSSNAIHARRQQERATRDAMAHIQFNKDHLRQEARARIAKSTCEFVRGSYLLKVVRPRSPRARAQPVTGSELTATAADTTSE